LNNVAKFAGVAIAALVLSTVLVQAGALIDVSPQDHTPVPVDTYNPPILVETNPTINYDGPALVGTGPGYVPGLVQTKKQGSLQRRDIIVAIGCQVAGTPTEFPDDLFLVNKGTAPLAAGTTIKWQVKGTGHKGYFALNADIAAGAGFKASGVLGGGVEAGLPCSAKVI